MKKRYTIYFINNVGSKKNYSCVAIDKIEAINKLLSYTQIKKVVSVTEIITPMFNDNFLGI